MASYKEGIVIIIDVGKNSQQTDEKNSQTFLSREIDCTNKILQHKLFSSKKDEIGLVLMGTKNTDNQISESTDGYEHICEAHPMTQASWSMIRLLKKQIVYEGANADWLDALIIAMDVLRREEQTKVFKNKKIILFTTFSTYVNDEHVLSVIQGLNGMDVELVVITDHVEFDEIDTNGLSQGNFSQRSDITQHQKHSESLVHQIISGAKGYLTNFNCVLDHLMKYQRRKARPCFSYCNLDIGSNISIQVAVTIRIREEKQFQWVTESIHENMYCRKVFETYKDGEQIEPAPEDLIKGYLLGTTPIAYDESLGVRTNSTEKGIKCLYFTHKTKISNKYFCGKGTYIVVPKDNCGKSENMLLALIKAMHNLDMVMIVRRIYQKGGRPKLYVLIPNYEMSYPCLSMIGLIFAEQYLRWYFPPLLTEDTEPSLQQIDAIDKLINSMDLMDAIDEENGPTEAFISNNLLNISVQYIYEAITNRAINPKEPLPDIDNWLSDAINVPAKVKLRSKEPLDTIKSLFELKEIKKPGKKELIRKLCNIPSQSIETHEIVQISNDIDEKNIIEIGTINPVNDIDILYKKGEKFSIISEQVQNVLYDLIFLSMIKQYDKAIDTIKVYREYASKIAPWEYNEWIKNFKEILINRKKLDFWKEIVKEKLGLISISDSNLAVSITEKDAEEFYEIKVFNENLDDNDQTGKTAEDLFEMM